MQMHFFFCIFLLFFRNFFAFFGSVLPSVSFCCGNPWANLCHMYHFDKGVGANAFICIYLHFCPLVGLIFCTGCARLRK